MSEPRRILVADEKHGTRYFDASTFELLDAACRKLLKQRLDEGWYIVGPEPSVDVCDIEKLPTHLVEMSLEQYGRQQRQYERWQKDAEFEADVRRVVDGGGKPFRKMPESYYLLDDRTTYEYERIELTYLESVDE